MNLEPVQKAYSSAADLYISLFGSGEHAHPDDLALFRRHLSGTVLDLGCGPGHLTAYLRSLGADVTGIDMVPEFVAHAKAAHPACAFRLGSMHELDVPAGSVSGLLSWYSLIHLPPGEVDGVLAEFRRVLAPGGRAVVGFFDGDAVEAFDHKVVTAYRWPVAEMSARLARAGFVEVERVQRAGERPGRAQAAVAAVVAPS
jgi:SAM-dependent methyltransferase